MSRLRVSVRRLPSGVSALDLVGFVDRHTVKSLDDTLSGLIRQGVIRLVVNCAELGYLSSAGIGMLIGQLMRVHQAGGDMKFYGMSPQVRALMDKGGFSQLLEIFDTETEAVSRFRRDQGDRPRAAQPDPHTLTIDVAEVGARGAVVRLGGDVDRHTIDALEHALVRAVEGGRTDMVVNFAGVTHLSSAGMGLFYQVLQKVRGRGGDIRFCHMRDNALAVLTMLGFQNFFQVFEAEEEAVGSYEE